MIHSIWQKSPQQATYFWFQSLQWLRLVFQTWIKNSRYHPTQGFIEACNKNHQSNLILDSTTPSPVPDHTDTLIMAMNQYDMTFAIRWYQTSPHDASWANPTPPGHFPAMPPTRLPPPLGSPSAPKKAGTQPAAQQFRNNTRMMAKDFVSLTPLLETILPLNLEIPVLTQLIERFPKGIPYPKFPDASGTCLTTICFRSAFASPQNCCTTSLCKERRPPRQTCIHVDPSQPEWKSKPEPYWAPLVTFLVDPRVSPILQPLPALKALTPSTNWT
jgi:hypothetical protein